jgi:arylsulfatase
MWKLTGFDGGNRVPAFVHYPQLVAPGVTDAFATVMDLYPTILELTGAVHPGSEFRGRAVVPLQGVSLVPLLEGQGAQVHPPGHVVGFEVNGHGSLHAGNWKIVHSGNFSGARWQLFDMNSAAGERIDLSTANPERLDAMLSLWKEFAERNGIVISDEDDGPRLPF